MPIYRIEVAETWTSHRLVDADTVIEAVEKLWDGEYDEVKCEYLETPEQGVKAVVIHE